MLLTVNRKKVGPFKMDWIEKVKATVPLSVDSIAGLRSDQVLHSIDLLLVPIKELVGTKTCSEIT